MIAAIFDGPIANVKYGDARIQQEMRECQDRADNCRAEGHEVDAISWEVCKQKWADLYTNHARYDSAEHRDQLYSDSLRKQTPQLPTGIS